MNDHSFLIYRSRNYILSHTKYQAPQILKLHSEGQGYEIIQVTKNDDMPPIAVRLPLEGEWLAVQTPGHKIPSHGTNQLGQRYAYDFVTREDMKLASGFMTGLRFWFGGGIPLTKSTSWKQPIFSPIGGKVIAAKDNWPEPNRASPMDLARIIALGLGLRGGEQKLRRDHRMIAGQHIADVGHTGNSSRTASPIM